MSEKLKALEVEMFDTERTEEPVALYKDPVHPENDMPTNYDPFHMAAVLIKDKTLAKTASADVVQRLAHELLKYKDFVIEIMPLGSGWVCECGTDNKDPSSKCSNCGKPQPL